MTAAGRPRLRRERGFTMIEIMMSIVVFVTAAVGLVAFEDAIVRSNTIANDVSAATYIAEFWLERGRVESQLWTTPGGAELTTDRTPLLNTIQTVGLGAANSSTGWQWLPAGAPGSGRGAAVPVNRHLEVWPGSGTTHPDYAEFCVQYRLTVLVPGTMLRMEVRAMWFKIGLPRPAAAGGGGTCAELGMVTAAGEPDLNAVNTVQVASTLWANQVSP